jgi:hypothetical protein
LSPVSVVSVGGIIWTHPESPGGAQTLGDDIQSIIGQICHLILTRTSLEPGCFYWDNFHLISTGIAFWTSFPVCSNYRASPESSILLIYPCMHQIYLLTDDYLLYFQYFIVFPCLNLIIHIIGRLMFLISACIIYITV